MTDSPHPSGGDHAIDVVQLRRSFGDVAAVDGVNLTVATGEIYGFLGPNGAGKSTTVRMLTTLLRPTSGRATVAGFDIADQPGEVRLRIGAALQEAALDPKQTGRELLDLQGRLYGLSKRQRQRRLDDLMQLVDIGEAIDRRIGTYSGGMKRRLDLAAALVHQPSVVFLDEPTTGLDPVSRAAVWAEVRRLNSELGVTIFLTTQYLEEADVLADRVGIIAHGRLVAEGTPDALKRSIGSDVIVASVRAGQLQQSTAAQQAIAAIAGVDSVEVSADEIVVATTNGAGTISPVAIALAAADVAVTGLTLRTPTLDDVFLHVTGERMAEASAA